ncbi:MAG: alkaline phosphatase D family protein [bacterium]|nr:alkaline phosphatase D family protein [bacterium]
MFGTYVLILFWLFIPFSTRAEPLRLAFGSCARIDLPQPIWHTIAQWHPDVFVTLGDIIYADTHNLRQMRAMYGQMDHQAEFAAFRKTCPIVGIWDDHDFGENDGHPMPSAKGRRRCFWIS